MTDQREAVARAIFEASTFYGKWDNQPQSNKEVCFSMADAAIAAMGEPQGVVVKPLEWRELISSVSLLAKCSVGKYHVTKTKNTNNSKFRVVYLDAHRSSLVVGFFDGLEAAKAAAQADFDRCILSALTTTTEQDEGVA